MKTISVIALIIVLGIALSGIGMAISDFIKYLQIP